MTKRTVQHRGNPWAMLVALAAAAAGCGEKGGGGASSASDEDVQCPSIHLEPSAELKFSAPLSKEGTYEVFVDADGKTEECTIEVAGIGPERRSDGEASSPPTRTRTTCKLVGVSGITGSGHVAGLGTAGTPASLSLRILFEGKEIANARLSPTYEPDRCGFIRPIVEVATTAP